VRADSDVSYPVVERLGRTNTPFGAETRGRWHVASPERTDGEGTSSVLPGAVVVVTGGAGGIGAALARRFTRDGAAAVVVADRDEDAAARVADQVRGAAGSDRVVESASCDVTNPASVADLVATTVSRHGRLDLYCSNAGIITDQGLEAEDARWRASFEVNVMAHVHAARSLLTVSRDQPGGVRLLVTASAAGLLTHPSDASYSATKHAAVGLAEWLAITHDRDGLTVQVLAPLGVATPMLLTPLDSGERGAQAVAASGAILDPDDVADAVAAGLASGAFLVLPHPEVARYWAQKAADPHRWLHAMRQLRDELAVSAN
jgi:NAD(P)-dependent dehydrogenase (short-subunit alcohol dehydrogenase family)